MPFWLKDTMKNTIGHRETEKQIQLGVLNTPEEALRINLVDELAEDQADLMAKAEKQIQQWSRIPGNFKKALLTNFMIIHSCL
jgi:3,2-trans-enoyl-CoA isomerase